MALAFMLSATGDPMPAMMGHAQEAPLDEWKRQLIMLVDDVALRKIGSGALADVHRDQADEAARAMIAGGELDPASYPMLSELVGIVGDDIASVARIVWEKSQEAVRKRAAINGLRIAAKTRIRAASTSDEARAAYRVLLSAISG